MELYPLFILMAAATVFSPGPGVIMTLTNSLHYGFKGTFGGILGISVGALLVAAISATSLGVLLAASATAFTVMKFIGAAYLIYLGIKLWKAPAPEFKPQNAYETGVAKRFVEGLSLQITNPKVIFFFLSVFPQFIQPELDYSSQFALQVLTYSALVVIIHCAYAVFALKTKSILTSQKGGRTLNRLSGSIFIFFGAALATAKKQ